MASLFLLELEIDHKGIDNEVFLKTWVEDIEYYLGSKIAGQVKHSYKVVAQRTVLIVIETTAADLDKIMMETPLMKKLGDQIKIQVTALVRFETYANNLNRLISSKDTNVITESRKLDGGCHILMDSTATYTGHTYDEAIRLFAEEATLTIGLKQQGVVVDAWKCVGTARIIMIFRLEKMEELEEIILQSPLMMKNGNNVSICTKPLDKLEDVKAILENVTK